ncbi:hypothetical protein HDV05_002959 [Chytridiales sp. JEL 0842]|nr:hypothetical protein HDV05_002959 [Chytridiales sp. JEL 0842]
MKHLYDQIKASKAPPAGQEVVEELVGGEVEKVSGAAGETGLEEMVAKLVVSSVEGGGGAGVGQVAEAGRQGVGVEGLSPPVVTKLSHYSADVHHQQLALPSPSKATLSGPPSHPFDPPLPSGTHVQVVPILPCVEMAVAACFDDEVSSDKSGFLTIFKARREEVVKSTGYTPAPATAADVFWVAFVFDGAVHWSHPVDAFCHLQYDSQEDSIGFLGAGGFIGVYDSERDRRAVAARYPFLGMAPRHFASLVRDGYFYHPNLLITGRKSDGFRFLNALKRARSYAMAPIDLREQSLKFELENDQARLDMRALVPILPVCNTNHNFFLGSFHF